MAAMKSPLTPEALRKRRYDLFHARRFMRDLRRVVRVMRQLEALLLELGDGEPEADLLHAWQRAGVGWDRGVATNWRNDYEASELADSINDILGDVNGFLWALQLIADMFESHLP